MNELKDYDIMDIEAMDDERLEKSESGKIQATRVYIKSEADKVIARQKYKRCMAMAKWCENAILGWMGHRESYSSQQRYIKVMLYTNWHKRWLELAEKFKE